MKKIYSLILVCIAGLILAHAQEVKMDWGKSKFEDLKPLPIESVLGSNEQGYYMITTYLYSSFYRYNPRIEHFRFDHTKESSTEVDFTVNTFDLKNEGFILTESNILAFGSYYDKKENKNILYGCSYTFAGKIEKKWTKVDEIISDKNNNAGEFNIKISEDKKNVLLFHLEPYDRNENEKFSYKVITSEFELLWEKDLELPFKDKNFVVKEYRLDQDANVIMLARIDKDAKKIEGVPMYFYKILLYDYKKDKLEDHDITLDNLFISEITFRLAKDNSLVIGGFFSRKEGDFIFGTFYQRLNKKSFEVEKSGQKDFPKNFLNYYLSDKEIIKGKFVYPYKLKDLFLKDDGGAILVAEQIYVFHGGAGSTNYYHYNDILAVSINPDASIDWVKRIPKVQVSNSRDFLGSSIGVFEDKMYFIFNDNRKNFNIKKKEGKIYLMQNIGNAVVNLTTLDSRGNMNTEILFTDKTDAKNHLRPYFSYQYDKDKMLIFTQTKNQYKMGTVIFK